jgi:3-(methylthio)propanoyl-CoA dehydrogenase
VLAKQALAAQARLASREGNPKFNETKILGARFYAEQYLPGVAAAMGAIEGGRTVLAVDPDCL